MLLPHNSFVNDLLMVVSDNNYFEFDAKVYYQMADTAMGTKLTPSYTNIFISSLGEKYVYSYAFHPLPCRKFIDDFFLILAHGSDELPIFITHLNDLYPTIKFTHEVSYNVVPFLELLIYMKGNSLHTRLYRKPTDRHMYLNYNSDHPFKFEKNLLYNLKS